jgi:aerobic carbon-monoxide dehydrogenase medium subunit
MKSAAFDYKRAATLRAAAALLAQGSGSSRVLAGGQSLGPMLNLRLARPGTLIDIKRSQDFRALNHNATHVSIGAGWTHAEIEDGVIPDVTRGLMPFVASGIAYRAVRNRGTLGGSLAHADPAADWISTMAALGATIIAVRADGTLVRYAADLFVESAYVTKLGDAEVLSAVEVPRLSTNATWGYHKVARKVGEFASAIGIAILDRQRGIIRVVAGATEGRPLLLPRAAERLRDVGIQAATEAVREDLEVLMPRQDPGARSLHAVAVERALMRLDQSAEIT